MKVDVFNLREDAVVRRYVDLPKLFHLLLSRRIFLPSVGLLREGDPFECNILPRGRYSRFSEPNLKALARKLSAFLPERFFEREGKREAATTHYLSLVDGEPRAELEKCVWKLECEKLSKEIVCSCWYEGEPESEATWKLYANQHGVAIETTVKQLKASIKGGYPDAWNVQPDPPFEHCYTIAKVKYLDTSKRKLPDFYCDNPWMLKRNSFRYEREIRIFHKVDHRIFLFNGGANVEVDVGTLINRIVISPFLPEQTWVPIGCAIKRIFQGIEPKIPESKICVERSRLLLAPSEKDKIFEALSWKSVEPLAGLF
jgi:hypothetical protein